MTGGTYIPPLALQTLTLERAQIDWATLELFLTGEAPLPSDAIDRLVDVLGLHFEPVASDRLDEGRG